MREATVVPIGEIMVARLRQKQRRKREREREKMDWEGSCNGSQPLPSMDMNGLVILLCYCEDGSAYNKRECDIRPPLAIHLIDK